MSTGCRGARRHIGVAGVLALLIGCSSGSSDGTDSAPSAVGDGGGVVDAAFGDGGKKILGAESNDAFNALLPATPEGTVAVGSSIVGGKSAFLLTRLRDDGSGDPSFGAGGRVVTAVGRGNAEAWAATMSADGGIIVAGSAEGGDGVDADIAVARYLPDGRLDPTFGTGGTVVTEVSAGPDTAFSVTTDASSRTVVAGQCGRQNVRENTRPTACVVRYGPSGQLDGGFGTNGTRLLPIRDGVESLRGVGVDGRGRIVATGYSAYGTANEMTLFRLTPTGEADAGFGELGSVSYRGRGFTDGFALSLQADGMLVAGFTGQPDGSDKDFLVARFSEDGRLDPRFGDRGAATAPVGPGDDVAFALAPDAGGILLAGFAFNGRDNDIALARFSPNGRLDESFGNRGTLTIPAGSTAVVRAVVLQGPKAVLAGEVRTGEGRAAVLARAVLRR